MRKLSQPDQICKNQAFITAPENSCGQHAQQREKEEETYLVTTFDEADHGELDVDKSESSSEESEVSDENVDKHESSEEDTADDLDQPTLYGQKLYRFARSSTATCNAAGNSFQDMTETMLRHLTTRFAAVFNDETLTKFGVFVPNPWPSKPEDLESFGEDEVQQLATTFADLHQSGYNPRRCLVEWEA